MNDTIKISDKNAENFDKKQIALAIRNCTLNDNLTCSLKDDKIISSCNDCSLNFICDMLDDLIEEYTLETSFIIKKFTF